MDFIEKPNTPNKCTGDVIVDYRISKESVKTLQSMGIGVIFSCAVPQLYDTVNGHPDMQIHHLGGNRFVSAPEAYEHYCKVMPDADIIKGSKRLSEKYPGDIAYNAAAFGNYLICNSACTAIEILKTYKVSNQTILNVNQGYAKCSTCIVSDNAIITADSGIYNAALEHDIDALKVTEGHIRLAEMNYGFIGGASGLIAKDTLAVNGNINTYPDGRLVREFCKKHGVNVVSLNKGIIEDIGSIIPLSEK